MKKFRNLFYSMVFSLICLGFSGCSYYGGSSGCPGCDYRTYNSQCGMPSCTDNCGMSGYAERYPSSCI